MRRIFDDAEEEGDLLLAQSDETLEMLLIGLVASSEVVRRVVRGGVGGGGGRWLCQMVEDLRIVPNGIFQLLYRIFDLPTFLLC